MTDPSPSPTPYQTGVASTTPAPVFIDLTVLASRRQNAWIESINSSMNKEHLNAEHFDCLLETLSSHRILTDRLHINRFHNAHALPISVEFVEFFEALLNYSTPIRIVGGSTIGVRSIFLPQSRGICSKIVFYSAICSFELIYFFSGLIVDLINKCQAPRVKVSLGLRYRKYY